MNSKTRQDTYTMPLKQLLKLLETTADDAPPKKRPGGRGHDAQSASEEQEPEFVRY